MQMSSSLSTRLHYQHKSIMNIVEGLSDEQIRRQVITGKWSIFENIVHLQTYQHVFIERIKQLLQGNNPVFERYTAEADPLFLENCGLSSREVLHDLITTRKKMSGEMPKLPETDFEKTANHPVFGTMNFLQWLEFFLLHEAHHLYAVFRLAGKLRQESEQFRQDETS